MNAETPSILKIALKGAAALLLAFLLIELLVFTVSFVGEGDGVSDAELVSWCEDDYYARDFARLYDTLTLYDCYDPETYGVYHEAVEGYNLLIEHEQWRNAAETDRADAALEALEALAANPTHEKNRTLLEGFLAEATAE